MEEPAELSRRRRGKVSSLRRAHSKQREETDVQDPVVLEDDSPPVPESLRDPVAFLSRKDDASERVENGEGLVETAGVLSGEGKLGRSGG
jgi:hypothetical protein